MRVHFEVTHPAHVHMFKNAIWDLAGRGHDVLVTARDKEIAISLLRHYDIPFQVLSRQGRGAAGLLGEMLVRDFRLYRAARRFGSEIMVGIHAVFAAQVSRLLGIPSIVFDDLEKQWISHQLTNRFASYILTPESYRLDLGAKHVRYPGYHQLTHLHPGRFTPNPAVLERAGVSPNEPYAVVRLVSWGANHDIGKRGIATDRIAEFLGKLERCGRVFITSEKTLPAELQRYRLPVAPHEVHHLMHFARIYFGESSTTGAEAAVLGTPAVVCNSLDHGFLHELQDRYGLAHYTPDEEEAMEVALRWAADPDAKRAWAEKRARMLEKKIDVTAWLVGVIEALGRGERNVPDPYDMLAVSV